MQSYISHPRGTVFYHLIIFIYLFIYLFIFGHYLALLICDTTNNENYRKYILFNFRFPENMIFPSIAENQENMIFTLSVFTKMLFFMQC